MAETEFPRISELPARHFEKISVESRGFHPYERIKIVTPDLRSASAELGKKTKGLSQRLLDFKRKEEDYSESLATAQQSFSRLKEMSKTLAEKFTTPDGVNHLERYVESLEGFCEGAGITPDEGALLQMEDQAGCQTLLVQNAGTGEVAGLHTEEDEAEYARSKKTFLGKRWVEMKVGKTQVQFCSYAGVCSWGGASGIIEKEGRRFFQAADTINPGTEGPLWANAVAFMTMDAGRLDYVQDLAEKIKTLPKPIFAGGYILHFIEGGYPPKAATLEFGGGTIGFISPETTVARVVYAGVNYPHHNDLKIVDDYNKRPELSEEKRLMERRLRRLHLLGQLVGIRFQPAKEGWGEENVLRITQRVLKSRHGDWLGEWFSGLANDLVAQNVSLYVSPEGRMKLVVRKGFPKIDFSNKR